MNKAFDYTSKAFARETHTASAPFCSPTVRIAIGRKVLRGYRLAAIGIDEGDAMFTTQKIVWVILMIGLAGVLFLAFRGYLAPALLLDFANSMLC